MISTLFGTAEADTARTLIGGSVIADTRNDLLKQIIVAVANKSGGSGGGGDVVGPASSTSTAIAAFDGATGKLLKNSNVLVGVGTLTFPGAVSGTAVLQAPPVAGSATITLPSVTGTLATLGANGFTGVQIISVNGAASTPALLGSGTIFTGGSGTTTKPYWLIEPSGATAATSWNTSGTAFGVNLDVNAGRFLDLRVDGVERMYVGNDGSITTSANVIATAGYVRAGSIYANSTSNLLELFSNSCALVIGSDATAITLRRGDSHTLQLGTDAAGVSNQRLVACNRITSDGVGADLTISGGNGRGGAGGSLILSYYTTAGAATIGTLTEAMRINTLGQIILNNLPTSDPGVVGALYRTAGAVMISI